MSQQKMSKPLRGLKMRVVKDPSRLEELLTLYFQDEFGNIHVLLPGSFQLIEPGQDVPSEAKLPLHPSALEELKVDDGAELTKATFDLFDARINELERRVIALESFEG